MNASCINDRSRGFLPASGKHIYPSCHASIGSSVTAITGSRTTPEVSARTSGVKDVNISSCSLQPLKFYIHSQQAIHLRIHYLLLLFRPKYTCLLHFICHNCDDAAMKLVFNSLISQVHVIFILHTVFLTYRHTSMFKQVTIFIRRLSALKSIH